MQWWNKLTTFLKEVRAEMQKVSFPAREEVISTSIVVVVASVIFGVYLYLSDVVIQFAYRWLLRVFA
jgi:preprotein translocase subunit SecE